MFRPRKASKSKTIKIGQMAKDHDESLGSATRRQKTQTDFFKNVRDDQFNDSEESQEIRNRAQREVQMFYKGQYKSSLIMNLM